MCLPSVDGHLSPSGNHARPFSFSFSLFSPLLSSPLLSSSLLFSSLLFSSLLFSPLLSSPLFSLFSFSRFYSSTTILRLSTVFPVFFHLSSCRELPSLPRLTRGALPTCQRYIFCRPTNRLAGNFEIGTLI